jgi:hypothetical protein
MNTNPVWEERYWDVDESGKAILEIFGSPGLIILDFMFPKCMVCGNNVQYKSLPCSRECLDLVNQSYCDHPLCMFPREQLPERKTKFMYTKNHKDRDTI